ncbi:MAG: fibronectin type III domain-containing protein, partial [Desulfobacterales bacterium]|nr:fibronectin type III domain-containing protein [Desulfobacterales bacterium]
MKKILNLFSFQVLFIFLLTSSAYSEFGVLISSSVDKVQSQRQVDKFIKQNYTAFVTGPDSKGWYRICVGLFGDRKEADAHREVLINKGFRDSIRVVRIDSNNIVYPEMAVKREKNTVKNTAPPAVENIPPGPVANISNQASQKKAAAASDNKPPAADHNKKDVTLRWDANPEADLAGYRIYYDTDPLPPYKPEPTDHADEGPPPIFVDKTATQFTLHNLNAQKDYYFTISAYNAKGLESDLSNSVIAHSRTVLPKASMVEPRMIDKKQNARANIRASAPATPLPRPSAQSQPSVSSRQTKPDLSGTDFEKAVDSGT